MNHIHFCVNELSSKRVNIYTIALFCLSLICPAHANVRSYIKDNLDYFKNVVKDSLCPIPQNIMEDGSCRYQWFLDLEKSSVNTLPDSLIDNLWAITGGSFTIFPSNIGDRYMNDPFCVAFFVAVFIDTNMSVSQRNQAFSVLLNRTSSDVVLPHRKIIISNMNHRWISFEQKATMAALLKCTENERKSLFTKEETLETFPLRARALYGDKKAIAELVIQFDDTTKSYEKRIIAMKDLVTSGNLEAVRHVIKQFGRVYHPGSCIPITPQEEIARVLAYHHPGDPIFNEERSKAGKLSLTRWGATSEGPIVVAEYYKKLYAWMYDNYKVKPLDPPPYTFFREWCRRK
ncbi:MAG: hypothetical protein LBI42_15840 [Chitinispirillales bacterium]|jgi:hypothetical protein|nr:hypothetical protein [Chitinispirillales bacterium]